MKIFVRTNNSCPLLPSLEEFHEASKRRLAIPVADGQSGGSTATLKGPPSLASCELAPSIPISQIDWLAIFCPLAFFCAEFGCSHYSLPPLFSSPELLSQSSLPCKKEKKPAPSRPRG